MITMTTKQIDALLNDVQIGRLCLADVDGKPYALPFPFCWHEGALYLRIALTGRKGEILARNDSVCFEVDRCSATLDEYESVLIEGRLVEVNDTDEKARVRELNTVKYTRLRKGHRPGHGRQTPPQQIPLRKIVVERISGRAKEPSLKIAQ